MSNTYTQIHIQAVFAVKYRAAMISEEWSDDLYRYMHGIVRAQGHKLLQVNGMPDHVHILFGMRPVQSLSDLMQDIKGSSSEWINKRGVLRSRFSWQEGYGAFSYCKREVPTVMSYIANQKEHHRKRTFLEEYESLLNEFEVDYDKRYIFSEPI